MKWQDRTITFGKLAEIMREERSYGDNDRMNVGIDAVAMRVAWEVGAGEPYENSDGVQLEFFEECCFNQ